MGHATISVKISARIPVKISVKCYATISVKTFAKISDLRSPISDIRYYPILFGYPNHSDIRIGYERIYESVRISDIQTGIGTFVGYYR